MYHRSMANGNWMVVCLLLAACGSKSGRPGSSGSGGNGTGGQVDPPTGGTGGGAASGGGPGTGGASTASGGAGGAVAGGGGTSVATGGLGSGGAAGPGGSGPPFDAGAVDGAVPPKPLVWRPVTVPGLEGSSVTAIWGSGSSELYVGTNTGAVFHRTATGAWTKTSLSSLTIDWLWGSGSGDVYAGEGGRSSNVARLRHSTGNDVWTPVALPAEYTVIRGIWGPSANEVYVAAGVWSTGVGAVLHLKNGAWTAEPTGQHILNRVWGSSATDVYAIGSDGSTLYHSRGDGTWTNTGVGNGKWMYGVWGSGPGDVYVVMSPDTFAQGNAAIAHSKSNGTWALEHTMSVEQLVTVWGSGPGDVYVGGQTLAENPASNKSVLYRSIGDGQWSAVTMPAEIAGGMVRVIWGSSASNVYLGGFGTTSTAILLQGTPN